ncbi:DMT family transporter [Acinetobacter johnsonii]|uniref:DMT family transporter n=1 Tax=Acinetobacter johnsonii TaxID=40214 RepID=UPI0021E2C50D|nr:DMT family transporter [Acinetobacter johnsonii]MCV2449878.1 DMT family transporter [Acinetobacter johnsonii]
MLRAYVALVLLGIIWGTNFIYMKWATILISPSQTVFLRVLFGFLPLLVIAIYTRAINRQQLRYLPHFTVMSVLVTTLYYYGFVAGTALLPTSIAGLLSGSIPIFTFLASIIFLREEQPTKRMTLGIILGFLGIILSARPWESTQEIPLMGIVWMIVGTLSVGCSFVYARYFLSPLNLPPVALATWQSGIATLTLLLLTDFDHITAITSDIHTLWGVIIGLGMLGTGGAFFIYYYIIQKLGPVKAAGATYIAPIVAVIIGAMIGESIGVIELLALVLILGGVVLIQLPKNT